MKEKEIEERLVEYLKSTDGMYETIRSVDNTEARTDNTVAVHIGKTTQVNVALPDYDYELSIYISTHISDVDEDGDLHDDTVNKIREKINKLDFKEISLSQVFYGIPVVGFFFIDKTTASVDDQYGKCNLTHLRCRIVTSF